VHDCLLNDVVYLCTMIMFSVCDVDVRYNSIGGFCVVRTTLFRVMWILMWNMMTLIVSDVRSSGFSLLDVDVKSFGIVRFSSCGDVVQLVTWPHLVTW